MKATRYLNWRINRRVNAEITGASGADIPPPVFWSRGCLSQTFLCVGSVRLSRVEDADEIWSCGG